MPVLQGSNPWADALGGLLGATGAYFGIRNRERENKAAKDRQAALDQLTARNVNSEIAAREARTKADTAANDPNNPINVLDRQYKTAQVAHMTAEDQAAATKNQQTQKLDAFRQNLKLPANWEKLKPDDKIGYLTKRWQAAQQAGDDKTANEAHAMIVTLQGANEQGLNRDYRTQLQNLRDLYNDKRQGAQFAHQNEMLDKRIAASEKNLQTSLEHADARTAAIITAAMSRLKVSQAGANARQDKGIKAAGERQQAGFKHADAAAAKKPGLQTPQEKSLAKKIDAARKNGATTDQIRTAMLKDGEDPKVIDRLLGPTPTTGNKSATGWGKP